MTDMEIQGHRIDENGQNKNVGDGNANKLTEERDHVDFSSLRSFPVPSSRRTSSASSRSHGDHGYIPRLEGNLKYLQTLECTSDVMCCRFSPDGTAIAAGQKDGVVKIFSAISGQCFHSLADDDTKAAHLPATCIRFMPNLGDPDEDSVLKNVVIVTYASGMVKFWHYTSGNCIHTINETGQVHCLSISGDQAARFATSGTEMAINIYDMYTKQKINTCQASDSRDVMNGHRSSVFSIQYHQSYPHILVSAGWDNTVQFWDDREKHAIRKLYGPHVCGDALDIDFIHNHILTGSWRKDDVLQIWDFETGKKIKDVPQDILNTCKLYCAQWVAREFIVCGGTDQNMLRLIDRGTLNSIGQVVDLPQGVYSIDNDRIGTNPRMCLAAANYVYVIRQEKK